ncbi:MAG TPA: SDR family oxidoreductase [Hyphomicrobiaceae bacterium]|nr:SDR family oxidoreductase [Hyphomicrobiaceae bacterium]
MTKDMLKGRVALVTGSTRRIGREIVLALARAGADVVIHGRKDREAGEAVRREAEALRVSASLVLADVSDRAAVGRMMEDVVARHGRLDILVNNAAVRRRRPLEEIGQEEWREVVGIILDGAFHCAQCAATHLARGGKGRIINIGGDTAFTGAREHAHVVAAKSGLSGLTRALAAELGPKGVTVNMVSPGLVIASGDDPVRTAERRAHYTADRFALGRPGSPADIAAAVVALAGDDLSYVTGQTIHVNGGFYMT